MSCILYLFYYNNVFCCFKLLSLSIRVSLFFSCIFFKTTGFVYTYMHAYTSFCYLHCLLSGHLKYRMNEEGHVSLLQKNERILSMRTLGKCFRFTLKALMSFRCTYIHFYIIYIYMNKLYI